MSVYLTSALAAEYQTLFNSCTALPHRQAAVRYLAKRITQQQRRYQQVERATTVPWQVVAVIHTLEASLRFNRHLHNGDPLHSRTVQVPANRPLGTPPFTWEESAIDALHYTKLNQWQNWSLAGTLFTLEAYNGWGYRRYHSHVLSPYLWSFSNHYTQGKYASDGKFDATLMSNQCGAAVLLKALNLHSPLFIINSTLSTKNSTLHLYPGRIIKAGERQRSVVKTIQRRLNTLSINPALTIDGYFGPKTTQAVITFQASTTHNKQPLQIDGLVGPKTWHALFSDSA